MRAWWTWLRGMTMAEAPAAAVRATEARVRKCIVEIRI